MQCCLGLWRLQLAQVVYRSWWCVTQDSQQMVSVGKCQFQGTKCLGKPSTTCLELWLDAEINCTEYLCLRGGNLVAICVGADPQLYSLQCSLLQWWTQVRLASSQKYKLDLCHHPPSSPFSVLRSHRLVVACRQMRWADSPRQMPEGSSHKQFCSAKDINMAVWGLACLKVRKDSRLQGVCYSNAAV